MTAVEGLTVTPGALNRPSSKSSTWNHENDCDANGLSADDRYGVGPISEAAAMRGATMSAAANVAITNLRCPIEPSPGTPCGKRDAWQFGAVRARRRACADLYFARRERSGTTKSKFWSGGLDGSKSCNRRAPQRDAGDHAEAVVRLRARRLRRLTQRPASPITCRAALPGARRSHCRPR